MPEPMSRRGFLAKGAAATVTGVAATVAATNGLATVEGLFGTSAVTPMVATSVREETDVTPLGTDVVAHVRNASTGEVSIMHGEHEVIYHDRALVSKLLKGARSAGQKA